ncbi:hypothetical protein A7K50_12380 [Dehalobacter sp. MCB1]|uniref:DNA replication complex subunit Gins51 n=1 Tax=Dehalobacter sp. MCB1 TaxID=1844756 RepID=UPI000E6D0FF5|nr:hypothetical protein [Dehalobacter sp. MCB1]RJE46815.1 hypothetical protein A7K50_12380 [Dehalobacter sp. MCB1]
MAGRDILPSKAELKALLQDDLKNNPALKEAAAYAATKKDADTIMERGNVLKFLTNQAQKNHIGDEDVLKHLLASIACTNSLTSAGIQPELNGEKGHGKTDAVRAVFHLVPAKWKLAASVSAKSLYYHKGLLPGSIVFSDDVQWSDDLISTVKRSMGNFQEPQTHFTLDANRNPLPHIMPPRLVWWLSSVESVSDDQLKDRQYSLDIDDGKDHSAKVSDYLRKSRSQKRVRFSVDRGIEIAREIVSRIKEHEPFRVVIDCAEFADWKVKEDHRTQNKFWDLVEAFAIMRFKQRYIDDDGWLHASVEDFNEAKTIFMRRKANHRTGLTNAQTKIVRSVIALQNEADGATQARIAEDLGVSQQAVSKGLKAIVANTRFLVHSPGVHGEDFYKSTVIGLEVVYGEGDIVTLPDDYNDPQPPYNHLTTNHTTIKNDNTNCNQSSIQPNKKECSKSCGCEGQVVSSPYHSLENGCKVVKSSSDTDSPSCKEVVSKVVDKVESTILRFLQAVPTFVGVDLRKYGPFGREDVGTVPSLNAKGLVAKGVAVAVTPGVRPLK